MPITEHLSELRKRFFIIVASVFIVFIITFTYSETIFNILSLPLKTEMKLSMESPYIHYIEKKADKLVFLGPAEGFWMHIKISFFSAIAISLPMIFCQLWLFVSPGLLQKEKKYFLPFMVSATLLFCVGVAFCFFIVLPFAMTFLLGYKTQNFEPMLAVGRYTDFCLKFILSFGVVFELPIIIIFMTKFGIVTPKTLAKQRKYAVLFAFVAAALLTPTPDALNQTLMAVPIIVLYEVGILLSRLMYREKPDADV